MINKINTCYIHKVIPLAFDESMSYLEKLCNMLYKLNETIDKVNSLSDIVDNIDVNFKEINEKIDTINNEIVNLYRNFEVFEDRINTNVNDKLNEQYSRTTQLLNDYQNIFNSQLRALKTDLENKIREIELGNIDAYDPTTGKISNINLVLQNIYDAVRNNAITCDEFDELNLTCTAFQNYQIDTYNFDLNAKIILI